MALVSQVSSTLASRCGSYEGRSLSGEEAALRRVVTLIQRELGIGVVMAKACCAFETVSNRVLRKNEPPERWIPHSLGKDDVP